MFWRGSFWKCFRFCNSVSGLNAQLCVFVVSGGRREHMQRAEGKLGYQSLPSTFLETWPPDFCIAAESPGTFPVHCSFIWAQGM